MNFTIDRADLLAAIDKCALAVDAKNPTESLRLMMVDATKKKSVRFAAVGEFCSVDTVAIAEMQTGGTFNAIPAHLRDVVGAMPQGRLQFTMKGTRITVKSLVSSRKASFETHTAEVRPVEDPGKEAAWQQVDSQELARALRLTKHASTWIGRTDPVASLLIPTEAGLNVFGCNMYLITVVETKLQMSGKPIVMPATAAAVLALMAPDDANVEILADNARIYIQNCDTLVSARLFDYPFLSTHERMLELINDNVDDGPLVDVARFAQGVKSLHGLNSFAGASERHDYGFQLHLKLGKTVVIEMALAAADGKDEFDAIETGSEFIVCVNSRFVETMLTTMSDVSRALVQRAFNDPTEMFIMRSDGIVCGLMTAQPRGVQPPQ